ncbi:C-type lectin domain family 4 member C-like [Xiphophorus maculatus]|uniref:C-type lectin domain family 4 member C-like n=1 Tax=Xiphophorus maculatus TaxID=8083 RepID=UPI000C6CD478|nr:C-type lectin domain family 4 member C-like [Xiphophorus maculatus]
MAVNLGSGGYDNPVFKARKVTDVKVSSGDIYENLRRTENCEQQKPKSNSDVTPKETPAMMPNVKVHLVLVSVGILSVLLLVSIGFFSWAGWKMNQLDEAFKKHSAEIKDLGEKSQNETEKLNQKIQLIQKFNTFLINEHCNSSECLLCQTGWTFFNESCYFLSKISLTWDQSRLFCQFKSADLVIINNLQEQKFIYDNLNSNCWLGLYKSGNDWYWVDNRIDTLRFWRLSDPQFYSYALILYRSVNHTVSWASVPNTYSSYPLCEQKAFKVSLN